MPNTTNEELKRLIQRLVLKVNTIEEKLDLLLEDRGKTKDSNELVYLDEGFKFTPIMDDVECKQVSKKITLDREYKKNLQAFMSTQAKLSLEDLFSVDFLLKSNHSGACGLRNLETLVPYNEIYLYVHMRNGQTEEEVKRISVEQLNRVKKRVKMIKQGTPSKTVEFKEESRSDEEVIMEVEALVDEDAETDDADEGTEEEIVVTHIDPWQHDHDFGNKNYRFSPIGSDQELSYVSDSIKTDTIYLRKLRLQTIEDSNNGNCRLDQLFTIEYLDTMEPKNLFENVPYKAVYLFFKKQTGLPLQTIETDARNELKRLKNRLRNRRLYQIEKEKRKMIFKKPEGL